ncbi:hypothetical protein [Pontivivens ytuae]|uniref:Uncharacterized protein n=1 Tax=Pontivivens ytuae TaxID=2789856 RepID=A0A7S9LNV8_9RHOB|nr:hypothetical protein [Pontivivens ytuae]QPH52361.1 hypothetical protein I0K15_11035 [Pontivivens ytuae]
MPLDILIALVVLGIAGIVALVHFTGGSARRSFADGGEVHDAWLEDWPQDPPRGVDLSSDGRAAIVELAKGETGLIWVFGADTVSIRLAAGDIHDIRLHPGGLSIRLNRFETPSLTVTLDAASVALWTVRLARFAEVRPDTLAPEGA